MTHHPKHVWVGMMLHYLRIAVTALSITTCVLLIVLWVRSYNSYDYVSALNYGDGVSATSWGAILTFLRDGNDNEFVAEKFLYVDYDSDYKPGFTWDEAWQFNSRRATIPHWFFVAVLGFLAAVPWIHWSKRFSLRTLLIATTLIAVALGLIVVAM